MSERRVYLTTAIPYVNGVPHLGHALEVVQADVLARHHRSRGAHVRFLSGTDDNALKNAQAAEEAGVPVAAFVTANADRFQALAAPLQLSYDDFIRTSTDPRHRPGVERLWRACAAAGDLYHRDYRGLYCHGCEAFLTEADLSHGACREHRRAPEAVVERNWFFRLSRHQEALTGLIERGDLTIEPAHRQAEVLAFIRNGLEDFSVSRTSRRARGIGIPVPDDPEQTIYVWFDALANYITALDYGTDESAYRAWWQHGHQRIHLIGKGILRFHAVYWPAILLSAGEPLPSTLLVHDYVTVHGEKISKSLGTHIDPVTLADHYGPDALRWWLLRDVPRSGDADFREAQLAARASELANDLGNLVNRTITLVNRAQIHLPGPSPEPEEQTPRLTELQCALPDLIDAAVARYDLRRATQHIWDTVTEANRYVSNNAPWQLLPTAPTDPQAAAQLAKILNTLHATCATLSTELEPFLPNAAHRIHNALTHLDPDRGRTVFPKPT